jgi:hypothetical protein
VRLLVRGLREVDAQLLATSGSMTNAFAPVSTTKRYGPCPSIVQGTTRCPLGSSSNGTTTASAAKTVPRNASNIEAAYRTRFVGAEYALVEGWMRAIGSLLDGRGVRFDASPESNTVDSAPPVVDSAPDSDPAPDDSDTPHPRPPRPPCGSPSS